MGEFVTIHPFEDGNGRITRTITDLLMTRADQLPQRFYSVSAEILQQRNKYYDALETTQNGNMDITDWLLWFLDTVGQAVENPTRKCRPSSKKLVFGTRRSTSR